MKPYVVDIEEHYHRGIIVYANSPSEAEEYANELCDCGDVDMERNCYLGRDVNAYPASEKELEIYDKYEAGDDDEDEAGENV